MVGKHGWGCLVIGVLSLIAVPLAQAAEEKVIRVGAMYPMTGRPGLYGMDSVAA
ncbi:MAG: hypothetical protein ACD_75C01590G0001, partial [uncultured bacterium]